MSARIVVSFRVRERDKAGPSGGKTLSRDAPVFILANFLRTPNAEEFIRKSYFASVKKIIREIKDKKNGTVPSDLDSTEAVIARSLSFTKDEVRDWVKSRDWSRAKGIKNIETLAAQMEKYLPDLALRKNHFDAETSAKIADKVIAAIADEQDAVADFLFTTLTTERKYPDTDLLMF